MVNIQFVENLIKLAQKADLDASHRGRFLRYAREEAGWRTAETAACETGISVNTIRAIEKGVRKPNSNYVEAIKRKAYNQLFEE